ncbi:Purple acid Phosphatase, N-terminal domain [Lachnospiraceae bacterium G11]|nr:Purple acid Phosphatase, N-terminal domain [Lachnospiraceae bacterium G11]
MNKKFRRLTNTVLALVLSLGMVFGLIPNISLVANAAQVTEQVATVSELDNESGYEANWTRTVSEPGNIQFQCNNGGKLRVRGYLSEGYTYTAGDTVTIDYTTALNGTEVELCYNTEASYVRLGTLSNAEEKAVFTLPETDKLGGDIQPKYIRFKNNNCGAGNTFGVYGITFSRTTDVADQPSEPETPAVNTQFAAASCDGGSFDVASDGTVTYSYNKGAWNYLNFDVKESDLSEYDKIVFDITPADGMTLGIGLKKADELTKLRDIWAKETIGGQRQTFEYSLSSKDFDSVQFRVDWPVWEDAPAPDDNGQAKQLIIHSIKLVKSGTESVNPSGKASVKVNVAETASVYNPEVNSDGSVKFTYNNITGEGWWHTVILDVNNCDITKYNQLRIDITPAGDDMTLGVYDYSEKPCFRGHEALPKSGRQVLKVDLTQNVEKLKLFCDATLGDLGERSFVIHRVWLCDKDEPEYTLVDKANFTEIKVDGSAYGTVKDSQPGGIGTVTPPEANGTVKIMTHFNGYTYKAGDVYVLYFDGIDNAAGGSFQMGWDLTLSDVKVMDNMLYITLPETTVFSGETTSFVRYKGASNKEGADIHLKGAHIYDGEQFAEYLKSLSTEEEDKNRSAKINVAASSGYKITENADGSYSIKYTRNAGADCWDTVKVDITNDDWEKYDQLRVEMEPATAMTMAVLPNKKGEDGHDIWLRSHVGFDTEDRQIVKINLTKDQKGNDVVTPLEQLLFYCDSQGDHNAQIAGDKESIDREFTVYKLWLCNSNDPDFMPTDKAKFVNFRGSGFSIEEQKEGGFATLNYKAGDTARLYMEFEDYTYTAGDVFVMEYDGTDADALKAMESMIGWADGDAGHYKFRESKEAGKYLYFELPADTEGKFTETSPASYIRFKGALASEDAIIHVNGLHIYDGAEWKKFVSSFTYNEDDCPQGLAISYYSDIYSRGFAWVTRDHIDEQYIEYIKATEGMTKEDVDWESADVKRLDATRGEDRVDTKDITWHMYKAHLENLEKNATYFFRAGNKDFGFYDTGSFTIEDDAEKIDKVTFLHLTDCQEDERANYTKWAKVLEAGFKTAPDTKFVAFTGDLINDYHGRNMLQWNWGLGEPKKSLLDSVIMPTSGNHDEWEYSFTDRFDIKWADYIKEGDKHPVTGKIITDGTLDEKTGGCYSFMYGEDVAFININTNDTNNLPDDFQSQYNWLEGELKKYENVKWKIVQVHKGMMSAGNHTNDGEVDQLRDLLPPLFAKYKVDLVLQGHDHVYTRSRSYLYGKDFDGKDYDGHTPSWLNNKVMYDQEFNGHMRELTNLEPQGTHYVTINFCASKSYGVEPMDKVIYPGVNPIEGNGTAIQLKGQPMFGVVSIEGDALTYDAYTYNPASKEVKLYDTFSVAKSADVDEDWNRGYRDRHEGMNEVTVQNIAIDSKAYDGKPVKLNLRGFVSSEPSLIDYSKLQFDITGDNGFKSKEKLPTEKGNYQAVVSIETIIETGKGTLMYYNDSTIIEFSIY